MNLIKAYGTSPTLVEPRCCMCNEPKSANCEHYRAFRAELDRLDPAADIFMPALSVTR